MTLSRLATLRNDRINQSAKKVRATVRTSSRRIAVSIKTCATVHSVTKFHSTTVKEMSTKWLAEITRENQRVSSPKETMICRPIHVENFKTRLKVGYPIYNRPNLRNFAQLLLFLDFGGSDDTRISKTLRRMVREDDPDTFSSLCIQLQVLNFVNFIFRFAFCKFICINYGFYYFRSRLSSQKTKGTSEKRWSLFVSRYWICYIVGRAMKRVLWLQNACLIQQQPWKSMPNGEECIFRCIFRANRFLIEIRLHCRFFDWIFTKYFEERNVEVRTLLMRAVYHVRFI